ncbi:MAG: HNH endonuclease [Pyrinomonadaceae bacterium]
MLHLLQRHGENACFKCGKLILRADELTLEHKQAWRANGAALFWDLDNIAFSHAQCNLRTGWVKREVVDGMLWCSVCKQSLPISCFHKESRQRTGYALLCKECANAKRRKVKAQGDCQSCGARRGTRPFRGSHNICLECHQARHRAYSKKQQRATG